jgi:hypothetical protein
MAIETQGRRHERLIALVLVICVLAVGFWEIMARRSSRAFQSFALTSSDFYGFAPASASWAARSLPVSPDPIEPNIAAYEVWSTKDREQTTSSSFALASLPLPLAASAPIFVRLVHGYNMPDCMRIKGYKVELQEDSRLRQKATARHGRLNGGVREIDDREQTHMIQVWRLTSATGDTAIWITGMLKAGDFSETDVDVRSMAFPRIGIPDDPGWLPHGVTMKSLTHPLRNFRLLLRAKWNNARCNLATFLRLKQPAWADDELLTLVVASPFVAINGGESSDCTGDGNASVIAREVEAYGFMLNELQKWRARMNNVGSRDGERPRMRGGK